MPLFTKTENDLTSRFDKWCYFLKNLATFDDIPKILQEPIFTKAFESSSLGSLSKLEYDSYTQSLMQYWDAQSSIETAIETATKKGEQIGIEKGKQIVLKVIKLFQEGKSILEISNMLSIPETEIKKIISDFDS